MVYIDQPLTTGFSRGSKLVDSEKDVAAHFKGFWKNFVKTFQLQGFKVYRQSPPSDRSGSGIRIEISQKSTYTPSANNFSVTGESYAGMYIPYIASGFLDEEDPTYFDVKGVQLIDPSINDDLTLITSK